MKLHRNKLRQSLWWWQMFLPISVVTHPRNCAPMSLCPASVTSICCLEGNLAEHWNTRSAPFSKKSWLCWTQKNLPESKSLIVTPTQLPAEAWHLIPRYQRTTFLLLPTCSRPLVGVYITLEVQPCLTVLSRGWRAEWFCPRAWVLVCSASDPSSVRELVLPGESYASSLSFRFLVCKMGGSLHHVMVNVFVYIMCLAWFLEHSEHPTNFS